MAPSPGGTAIVWCMPIRLAGFPSGSYASNSSPITWNAEVLLGPTFITKNRTSSPALAVSGVVL